MWVHKEQWTEYLTHLPSEFLTQTNKIIFFPKQFSFIFLKKKKKKVTYLLQEDITHMVNEVVLLIIRLCGVIPALHHGKKEVTVQDKELVQAREYPSEGLRVQTHLLPHSSPKHLRHDGQRLQVV